MEIRALVVWMTTEDHEETLKICEINFLLDGKKS
jgi:hypothetical protein